ncbi:MAG: TonB-dependent receptor [Vicinamibacterales bacterium]
MRPCRSGCPAPVRRLFFAAPILTSITTLLFASTGAYAAARIGLIVDQAGRPLPRAHVRIVSTESSAADRRTAELFADDGGAFELPGVSGCRIEVSMSGFQSASLPCPTGSDASLTVMLQVAPVEETVSVTATRTEAPMGQTGLSATTFSSDEIQRRQVPLVSDLLRTVPGASVLQTGGPGGVTGLFVRGGESNYNTVLLDGIPLNEPGGTFNFNNLTTDNIERVEVVRGANSSLFGSDAMSSVVQLFTTRGRAQNASRGTAQLEAGSYGTMHASAATSGATGRFDYALSASRYSTDNRVPNSGFDNTGVSANVGSELGEQSSLRAVFRADLGKTGTSGQTLYGRPDLDAFYEHHDIVGGVTFERGLGSDLHQRASYSLSSSNQASVNLKEDAPYTPSYQGRVAPFEFYDFTFDSHNTLTRHYASYQVDWHAVTGRNGGADHRFTALADWNGERARLEDRLASTTQHASRDNVGASLQHQLLWRRLATTAGLRAEKNENFGTAVVPRASAALTLHSGSGVVGETRLRGAAGLGIKEPTVLQSFSTSPYFRGNPDLQPERSRAVEIGVDQRLANDRVKLEASWFDNRYRNIIGLRPTSGYESEYFNIGLTRARGLEVGAEIAPLPSLRVQGSYTLVDSAILQSTSDFSEVFAVGQWAFRRPRHSGFVQATWSRDRITTNVSLTSIGRFVDSDFSSLEPSFLQNPGHTTLDARLSYRVSSKITGLLAVDNVTSQEYQEPLGYAALRRAARAGIRVSF